MFEILTTEVFDVWFDSLLDARAKARIQARIDRVEDGNFGDIKPVGAGVSELRIDHGPGFRVYLKRHGSRWIVLLAGGDKATQKADIARALKLAKALNEKD